MDGAALAAERKLDRELLVAHQGAAWTGAAYAGKLKPFKYYRKDRPQHKQSPDDMLAALNTLHEMGAPMTIRQVN